MVSIRSIQHYCDVSQQCCDVSQQCYDISQQCYDVSQQCYDISQRAKLYISSILAVILVRNCEN